MRGKVKRGNEEQNNHDQQDARGRDLGGTRGLLDVMSDVREAYLARSRRYARPTRRDLGGSEDY